ncbi:energy transducer TonB [Mesorhizobium sp. M2E.F.Ca.ET.209.01.1.1]|uniref:energy transducer TonB n=1 Tax=Mesorhizobium sp. M2E.F.Ca.ET.209.01.1.1 TaxID=2500526 RepID=UPI000FD998F8|nr:energy transducer TonB [Mesorhizobium sp. M2E.F.Ca.ET.209.01.1.1]RWL48077.1 MAG: energy transducer TonB [Mesorhizobium sp.]TGS17036.1 energy transducer TonB [Mesorhizobium sp. M2E.F.Ca.ET.209.01.1.1]
MQDTSDIPDTDSVLTAAPGEALAGSRPRGEHGKWTMAIAASCLVHGAVAAAFLISPGSKANLQDPAQAEGSDRSGANVAGSALNPEQQSINVALVPPPRPPAKPMPPAEKAPLVKAAKPQPASEASKTPAEPDILVANAPREDADSMAPDAKATEPVTVQHESASPPPTPARPPVPTVRPVVAKSQAPDVKSGAADGENRAEPTASKGKKNKNEVGNSAENSYRGDVFARLGKVNRTLAPSLQLAARNNAVVAFVVGRKGNIDELRILETSGSEVFDQAALGIVRKAAPFPPIPPEAASPSFEFEINIGPF